MGKGFKDIQMPNIISHQMQIKTAKRHHFTPPGWLEESRKQRVGEEVEKLAPCALLMGTNMGQLLWRTKFGGSPKS